MTVQIDQELFEIFEILGLVKGALYLCGTLSYLSVLLLNSMIIAILMLNYPLG